jgi:uracil-DNA glycosylase
MGKELNKLLKKIREKAGHLDMPVDKDVYDKSSKDHLQPILYAGSLNSRIGVLARDLGKDEVIQGEPLIGAGGQKLRRILTEHFTGKKPPKSEKHHQEAMNNVLFTNIVPYKPIGNKVFSKNIRREFAPLIAEFLIIHWKGSYLMTLGTEAFKWFEHFCNKEILNEFWKDDKKRYTSKVECELSIDIEGAKHSKVITIAPLPHPSPLNRRWIEQFPNLLKNRLESANKK